MKKDACYQMAQSIMTIGELIKIAFGLHVVSLARLLVFLCKHLSGRQGIGAGLKSWLARSKLFIFCPVPKRVGGSVQWGWCSDDS